MKIQVKKSDIFALLILLFPICHLIGGNLEYFDEIIGVVSFVYVMMALVSNQLKSYNLYMALLLLAVSFIGLISNFFSKLITDLFPIFVDLLWLWKTFATYIFFSQMCEDEGRKERIISILQYPAKLVIVLLLITSVIGQFINIGVTGSERINGIMPYGFFWNNGIQTGWLAFCCVLILSIAKISNKEFYAYLTMTIIPLLLTTSSLVYCWIATIVLLLLLMRKNDKFKFRYIVIIVLGVMAFVSTDLQFYFSGDQDSVRKTLFEYAIKVANMYFPFGSGFATYGSEMAIRYYSKLYISFGWRNSWALNPNSGYLNDNFFASIIGQFGWFGFALYLLTFFQIFLSINNSNINKRAKIVTIATVLTIFAVMIGSASAKSLMGICTFAVLGIVCGQSNSKKRTNIKERAMI